MDAPRGQGIRSRHGKCSSASLEPAGERVAASNESRRRVVRRRHGTFIAREISRMQRRIGIAVATSGGACEHRGMPALDLSRSQPQPMAPGVHSSLATRRPVSADQTPAPTTSGSRPTTAWETSCGSDSSARVTPTSRSRRRRMDQGASASAATRAGASAHRTRASRTRGSRTTARSPSTTAKVGSASAARSVATLVPHFEFHGCRQCDVPLTRRPTLARATDSTSPACTRRARPTLSSIRARGHARVNRGTASETVEPARWRW
jgi:hypothetical protein